MLSGFNTFLSIRKRTLVYKMSPYYHYKYLNGLQFVSLAEPAILNVYFERGKEKPKLLGIWRFKKLTNKNK
jgi:hypothetical protein